MKVLGWIIDNKRGYMKRHAPKHATRSTSRCFLIYHRVRFLLSDIYVLLSSEVFFLQSVIIRNLEVDANVNDFNWIRWVTRKFAAICLMISIIAILQSLVEGCQPISWSGMEISQWVLLIPSVLLIAKLPSELISTWSKAASTLFDHSWNISTRLLS